jgi:hypothetical protein
MQIRPHVAARESLQDESRRNEPGNGVQQILVQQPERILLGCYLRHHVRIKPSKAHKEKPEVRRGQHEK